MLSLLKTYPTLQLVTLSAENDWVKIYSKQQILLNRITKLADIIRHNVSDTPVYPGK